MRQCTLTPARVTTANGDPVDAEVRDPAVYQPTLAAGENTYTVTNVVTCATKLTLNKAVLYGPADPASWKLTALTPDGAAAGPNGSSRVTANVTPDATYPLAEFGGDANYLQLALPDVQLVPVPPGPGSVSRSSRTAPRSSPVTSTGSVVR